ncbi:acylneuraminate cytidylyltransferase family protein [Candidatus Gottesmanbacteria bacterium]|nr:acylneuraminate cytidylyltransferase family protein [Candidatus Gottesmanbacteria bacterium]
MKHSCIALIPARSGSKRIKHKNIRELYGHPLLAYSIVSSLESNIFSKVIVSTDSKLYADVARYYGADVPFLRPSEFAQETSPDIEWISYTLQFLREKGELYDYFAILRPTSPFRKPETLKRAWNMILNNPNVDSLRAVEKTTHHPAKMWIVDKEKNRMKPVMENPHKKGILWHSLQYPSLPEVYMQNASLEIAKTRCVFEHHSISGEAIMPFFTKDDEGVDVNTEYDWYYAQRLIKEGKATLPKILHTPFTLDYESIK